MRTSSAKADCGHMAEDTALGEGENTLCECVSWDWIDRKVNAAELGVISGRPRTHSKLCENDLQNKKSLNSCLYFLSEPSFVWPQHLCFKQTILTLLTLSRLSGQSEHLLCSNWSDCGASWAGAPLLSLSRCVNSLQVFEKCLSRTEPPSITAMNDVRGRCPVCSAGVPLCVVSPGAGPVSLYYGQ